MATVKIIHNAVTAKVIEPERDVKLFISQLLSYKVVTAAKGDAGVVDRYSSLFEMRPCQFPAGFVRLVKNALTRAGHRVIVKGKEAPLPRGPENPIVDEFPEDLRYDYQREVMSRLISLQRMIAQVATGGGKSRIFKLCAERLGLPTLFLTTRKSLAYQMAKTYENDIKKPYGFLGDGQWRPYDNGVNFAIVDTLLSRLEKTSPAKEAEKLVETEFKKIEKLIAVELKAQDLPESTETMAKVPPMLASAIEKVRKSVVDQNPIDKDRIKRLANSRYKTKEAKRVETAEFLEKIGFLCIEEAHELSDVGFYHLANQCKNAFYRLALTGTPFMKDSEGANMRLMAATGPVGIKVSEKLLIDRGILATPYFKYAKPAVPAKLRKTTPWQSAYTIGVVENSSRNVIVVNECIRAAEHGLTSMVLVQHSRHGYMLKKMLTSSGLRAEFIFGEHDQADREAALGKLARREIDVLIGSTILDVGIDVPSVGLVALAGGGKPEVAVRQRIGRGARAKKTGPNVFFVLDFEDTGNKHLRSHYLERRRIVEDTPGFCENIVEDFDYKALGFAKLNKAG